MYIRLHLRIILESYKILFSQLWPFLFAVYVNDIVGSRYRPNGRRSSVILYVEDILISTSSIAELQLLFHIFEHELFWLDMLTNIKIYIVYVLVLDLRNFVVKSSLSVYHSTLVEQSLIPS